MVMNFCVLQYFALPFVEGWSVVVLLTSPLRASVFLVGVISVEFVVRLYEGCPVYTDGGGTIENEMTR